VHTLHKAQTILDQFVMASRRFGLSVSLKKTEVLFQPSPDNIYATPVVTIGNTALPVAGTFCYLGSRIHRTGSLDDEITARLAKATAAFGCLRNKSACGTTTEFEQILNSRVAIHESRSYIR